MATYEVFHLAPPIPHWVPNPGQYLQGFERAEVSALNEAGQTAGESTYTHTTLFKQRQVATFWNSLSGGTLLEPPGDDSAALGINDGGSVVGTWSRHPTGGTSSVNHGFVYHNGSMTDMGPIFGTEYSHARDINNAGKVVGSAGDEAFVYDVAAGSSPLFLGKLPGHDSSYAWSINNHGAVVGGSKKDNDERRFLYTGGSLIDLGPGTGDRFTTEISDSGLIAGSSGWVAAVYNTNDSQPKFEPIGRLPGHDASHAFSINDKGEVVGMSWPSGDYSTSRGFLYKDGVMTDLNDLIPAGSGWVLEKGIAINDAGVIAAQGKNFHGESWAGHPTLGPLTTPCLLVPAHVFRVPRENYRSLWEVLRGLLDDTPGVLWPTGGSPGGPPIPVHPNWRLDPNKLDVLSGLAVNQMASLINDPDVRRHVEEAGIRVMEESVRKLREGL